MQFSHSLLKKFVPNLPPKKGLIDKLNIHVFEAESSAGDMIEVSLPANRYSDASSYQGLARIIGAILKLKTVFPKVKTIKATLKKNVPVMIKDPVFCRRMTARYIAGVKIAPSPKWLVDILKAHGMRSINNLVDVTNYVMLETGQPTHAFDFDKMKGSQLVVRRAAKGESIELLDREKFKLTDRIHVLADAARALDIAAIKGGTNAELNTKTKNVLLTAGSFNGVTVYNTARAINLSTDASVRFSHDLSPALVKTGSDRATQLILELCGGQAGPLVDVFPKKPKPRVITFNIDRFNRLIGVKLSASQAFAALRRLGFKVNGSLVTVPEIRTDVTVFEDLAEEVANIYGYNNITPQAPKILVTPPKRDIATVVKERAKVVLVGLGCDEVYNYSFVSKVELEQTGGVAWWRAVSLENPLSENYAYLRPSLSINLKKTAEDNLRFFDSVKIFEVGRNFNQPDGVLVESRALGIALAAKSASHLLELKGVVSELLNRLGLFHFDFSERDFELPYLKSGHTLFIKSAETVIGYLGSARGVGKGFIALAELDLEKIEHLLVTEKEYVPISRHPIVARDISLYVENEVRIGDILRAIKDTVPKLIRDIDLIDCFEPKASGKKSLLFRLIFQADNRTLTDKEVNKEISKIEKTIADKFAAQIR